MPPPSNVLAAMLEMFETGDTSDLSVIADDYLDHQHVGSPLVGPEGFREVVSVVQRVFPNLKIVVKRQVADAESVAALLSWDYSDEHAARAQRETLEYLAVSGGQAVEHWGTRLDA